MSDKAQLQALSLIQLHVYTFSTQQHLQSFSQSHKLGCRRPDLAQKRVQWNRTPFCRRPPLWCDQHIFDYSYTQELWVLKETQKPTFDWIKRRDVRLISANSKRVGHCWCGGSSDRGSRHAEWHSCSCVQMYSSGSPLPSNCITLLRGQWKYWEMTWQSLLLFTAGLQEWRGNWPL